MLEYSLAHSKSSTNAASGNRCNCCCTVNWEHAPFKALPSMAPSRAYPSLTATGLTLPLHRSLLTRYCTQSITRTTSPHPFPCFMFLSTYYHLTEHRVLYFQTPLCVGLCFALCFMLSHINICWVNKGSLMDPITKKWRQSLACYLTFNLS